MKSTRRSAALRKLLTISDDVQRIRTRLGDPELRRDARTRLRRQLRSKTTQLTTQLSSYRFRGPLGNLLREAKLDANDFLVLSILLQRHLRADDPSLEGRAILSLVYDGSFEVLSGMDLLHENGRLRRSGLVVLADDEQFTDDVLDARFSVSEEALEAFQEEVTGRVSEDLSQARRGPYRSNREVLVDLRILHNLFKHRSERTFQVDRWDRVRLGNLDGARRLSNRIEHFWRRIHARISEADESKSLPAVRFFREHNLSRAEIVIVVHLLFKELYEGNAYADAAELIRLVSADELELIRSRTLMLESSTLRRAEILQLESMIEGRELTGEVHLSDWVVNYLFGASTADQRIRADEQLDWHMYLERIDDARVFFRDLESN